MLTLRGVALGAVMYAVLIAVYLFATFRTTAKAVHLMPGQQIGFDFRSMAGPIVRNPMFYITFIVLATIGSAIVQVWKTR
jgi:hypothetical protein